MDDKPIKPKSVIPGCFFLFIGFIAFAIALFTWAGNNLDRTPVTIEYGPPEVPDTSKPQIHPPIEYHADSFENALDEAIMSEEYKDY
jgi:hypothetical protein